MTPPSQAVIIRIVRMTLEPHSVDRFHRLFNETAAQIRAFDGCDHLELWIDARFPNIITTYSIWRSEELLDAYRRSSLFRETWAQTRRMFAAPPSATSYRRQRVVSSPPQYA
jgi:quinol monooxygenase YgiN